MKSDIKLHFNGPFTFISGKRSIIQSKWAKSAGVYLWTIRSNNGNYIHYVGETDSFAKRQLEHLINILGLNYGIWNPEKARQGISERVWEGLWRDESLINVVIPKYKELNKVIIDYVSFMDVFFAKTDADIEPDVRKHIEGSIGYNLRNNHKDLKLFYPDDNHIGTKKEKLGRQLYITSDENIKGLDTVISI